MSVRKVYEVIVDGKTVYSGSYAMCCAASEAMYNYLIAGKEHYFAANPDVDMPKLLIASVVSPKDEGKPDPNQYMI